MAKLTVGLVAFWMTAGSFMAVQVWAQATGGGAAGTGTGTGGGAAGPGAGGTAPSTRIPQNPQQGARDMNEMRRPIMLAGRVVTESGDVPPDSVKIERVCMGNTQVEGYTDSRGNFSFVLGQNNAILGDVSTSTSGSITDASGGGRNPLFSGTSQAGSQGFTERELWGCEIRAALAGYRSQSIPLAGRRLLDGPDLGVIMIRKMGAVEGRTVSATSLNAPKDAKKAFEKAIKALTKDKPAEAQEAFQKAIEIYPEYAQARFELGRLYLRLQKDDEAKKELLAAIQIDPKLEQPYYALASLAYSRQDWADVHSQCDKLLKINAYDYPKGYLMQAMAQANLGDLDAAVDASKRGIKIDLNRQVPQLYHVLGMVLAKLNDYNGAIENLRLYVDRAPKANNLELVRKQLAEVEQLAKNEPKP